MPLPPALPRALNHTRHVECRGYRRDDGLWDIEGHLVDTKPYDFTADHRGVMKADAAVHDMWIRLTIDDDMLIHGCDVAMDASPYSVCPDSTPNFTALAGIRIGKGWSREVNRRVGGVHGCTHLRELLRPIATTAYQTLYSAKLQQAREAGEARPRPEQGRPRHLNACHAYREDGLIVKEAFPEHYTGD